MRGGGREGGGVGGKGTDLPTHRRINCLGFGLEEERGELFERRDEEEGGWASYPISCFKHSGTDSSAAYPWSLSRSLSLKLAGSRSATLNLATAMLSARGRVSKSELCCASPLGSSVLHMARVESLQFSARS